MASASEGSSVIMLLQVSAGAYATAGLRGEDAMEDRHIVSTGPAAGSQGTLLAVFDGHRGPQVQSRHRVGNNCIAAVTAAHAESS